MGRNHRQTGPWLIAALAISLVGGEAGAEAPKRIAGDDQVALDVAMGTPVVLAGRRQTAYLKVGLSGFRIAAAEERAPANVSIVLDRSGSMSGDKIAKAKEAAMEAVGRLGPRDIVSVVAYNHGVEVIVPATRVRDRVSIYRAIDSLWPSGNTALFAGVSKGAAEVRKFLTRNHVNRVILLSDGLANEGPSSPGALGELGRSLGKQGISVSTIGLGEGYNEDLMVQLARRSDGNHAFAENATDLARIFEYEFGDVLSVVAREVTVEIRCADGVRPVGVLGRDAEIFGDRIVASLNQLYAEQEKFLMIELELPPEVAGAARDVATVDVRYTNAITRSLDILGGTARVRYSDSVAEVDGARDQEVVVASIDLLANDRNKQAVRLMDEGRVEEAREVLTDNAAFLEQEAKRYKSKKLAERATMNRRDKDNLDPERWKKGRKAMRKKQYELDMQQAF